MSARILVSSSPGERRVALLEEDRLEDYALHRPGAPDGVGDLHLGRIAAVLPALGGAFVTLGDETGFLAGKEATGSYSEGMLIAVRVTRSAQGGKGPRLTTQLEPAEREAMAGCGGQQALVRRGPGPVQRFAAARPDAAIICDDPAVAAELHAHLHTRVRMVARSFDEPLEAAIDALASPEIALPGGLRASIHPTPALVAIDMDGAASSALRRPKQMVQFAANRDALPSLLHQIRLRNLSGAILIDLAGVASRKRVSLAPDIARALARDPLQPRLLGFTALGLAEITRPRIHPPLHELQGSPQGAGIAALRAALAERDPAAGPASRVIRGGIAVIRTLQDDPQALAEFARRAGVPICLRMDASCPDLSWTIENG